ncbi:ribosome biogenesis protein ytm1 [Taxawa tesnikishii (nom. ined.)]|nr:ribosome biogenesis protein ytm1 [Dothideales sp. JES 119]
MATQTATTSTMATDRTSQVRIQLTSRSPDIELPEDTGPILVSTELRRYQLSTLVNRLLETEQPIPFEFLVNGQFLRTSLDDFLTANGISAETTLTVEYVRALIPRRMSRASNTMTGILSGGYDGVLRMWNTSGEVVATSASGAEGGHTNSVKAARFLSPTQLVSSSLDRTLRLWNYTESEGPSAAATLTPALELYGHTASVDALAVHTPSSRIMSASADHTVGLWSTTKSAAPTAPSNLLPISSAKRRKLSGPSKTAPQRGPLALLSGHSAPVSSVAFKPNDSTVAYSTSWDHSLKTWDLPTQTCVDTRSTAQSLLSVAAMQEVNLVAAGTSARHITLIDPRASATTIAVMTLRGHQNAVVSLAPSPMNSFALASGSHDGTVRVWDVRSVRAGTGIDEGMVGDSVFVVEREGATEKGRPVGGEGVKVFGVVWDESIGLVSAGEDKRVQIHRETVR